MSKFTPSLVIIFLTGISCLSLAEPFRPGEKLVYEASWGIVKAARIEFEITRTPAKSGKPPGTLLLRGTCQSLGVVNTIYPINSKAETYAQQENFIPIFFSEDRSEGRHKYQRTMTYDFDAKLGIWSNKISGHDKRIRLPRIAHDQLGAFYALRKNGLRPGSSNSLEIISDGRYEKINYKVSKPETKSVGSWGALPVLTVSSDDIMERAVNRKARMQMLVTADQRHIPLQIDIRASWGTVRLQLVEATGITGAPLPEKDVKKSPNRRAARS